MHCHRNSWDPILAGVDTNRYAYAGNDPINASDGNGHARSGGQPTRRQEENYRSSNSRQLIIVTGGNPRRDGSRPWFHWANKAEENFMSKNKNGASLTVSVTTSRGFQRALDRYAGAKELVVIGHSGRQSVHFGQENKPGTNLSDNGGKNDVSANSVDWSGLAKGATIKLWGCNAGSSPDPVAQIIANSSKRNVEAFANYTKLGQSGPTVSNFSAYAQNAVRIYSSTNTDDWNRYDQWFGVSNQGVFDGMSSSPLTFSPK